VKFGRGHGTVTGDGWQASVRRTSPRVRTRRKPRPWLVLAGFDEWTAQVIPLLFAVAAPPLLYIVLVRRGLERVAAAMGGLLLAVSPGFLGHATRVKPYTLDAFVAVCLLGVAWWLLDDAASGRRWRLLAVAGGIALVLSSPSAVYLAAALGTGLLALARRDCSQLRVAFAPVAAVCAFAALWYVLVLRPAVSPALTLFWESAFVPLDDGPRETVLATIVAVQNFARGAISIREAEPAVAIFAVAYGVALWRRPFVGLLLLAPLAIAFVLAMLEVAPVGTGRTDIYLYPAPFAAVAVALAALARTARALANVVALASAASLLMLAPKPAYPLEDLAPLVATLEANLSSSDAIVTYPFASYPFALYTTLPVDFTGTDVTATGFRLHVRRQNTFVPTESWPRDPLNFAVAVDRLEERDDSVWVLVGSTPDPIIYPTPGTRASGLERSRGRREVSAFPFGRRAIRQAFGDDVALPRGVTLPQYVDRVMRNAGYRKAAPTLVRTEASLTHWLR